MDELAGQAYKRAILISSSMIDNRTQVALPAG
jgi:hypothetical protein